MRRPSTLPVLWVDAVEVLVREEPAVAMMRFVAIMPDGAYDVARILTPISHLKIMADTFNEMLAKREKSLSASQRND